MIIVTLACILEFEQKCQHAFYTEYDMIDACILD